MLKYKQRKYKAIYLLPNLITTASLICGVLAILNATSRNFGTAAVLILIGAAIDGLDGTIARITKSNSIFGLNFDSLADLVTFGVAPGILYYSRFAQGSSYKQVIMAAALLYIVCGALRLAKYNVMAQDPNKKTLHFSGLPIPCAAGLIASLMIVPNQIGLSNIAFFIANTVSIFIGAVFMVSTFRFVNVKKLLKGRHQNFELLVLAVMIFAFAMMAKAHLFQFILAAAVLYVLSGPFLWVYDTLKQLFGKKIEHKQVEKKQQS